MWKEKCKIAYRFKGTGDWLVVPKDCQVDGSFKFVCDHNPYHDKRGRFTSGPASRGYVKSMSLGQANVVGTAILANAYESNRVEGNLNLVARSEIGFDGERWGLADYGKCSVETANAFNEGIAGLSARFNTNLTCVRPMRFMEYQANKNAFASVYHELPMSSASLLLNVAKVGDLKSLTGRIRELSDKGYSVKVPKGSEARYVVTHEFAHTLLPMRGELSDKRNFTKADYGKLRRARREVQAVYERYAKDVTELKNKAKAENDAAFRLMLDPDGAKVVASQKQIARHRAAFQKHKAKYDKIKVSDYALASADEFLAECFTDAELNPKPSSYSREVHGILTRHFGR